MARYERLPIYKAALDVTVHFEKLVAGFSRYHKDILGTELREASRPLLMQVLRADCARARTAAYDIGGDCAARVGVLASWCERTKVSPP